MEIRSLVDASGDALHRLGWSAGDMAFNDGRAVVWQVFAYRGDQADHRSDADAGRRAVGGD